MQLPFKKKNGEKNEVQGILISGAFPLINRKGINILDATQK